MITFVNVWGAGERGLYVSGFTRTENPVKSLQKMQENMKKY